MNITIIGIGYVGLVTAACMAEKGYNVICLDNDILKINNIVHNNFDIIYEEGLKDLLIKNKNRLTYTTDIKHTLSDSKIIFVCVGTPENHDGSVNLKYINDIVNKIAKYTCNDCVVIIKSTVPVGTCDDIDEYINTYKQNNINIMVVSNPEFLSQGTAVNDTLNADRIVIGVNNQEALHIMKEIYKDFGCPLIITNRKNAEMIKYTANNFLALKISFINEIANLCDKIGADINDIVKGISYDKRIGDKFFRAGIGYGGSCFPKDTKALCHLASKHNYELKTIKATIEVNNSQKLILLNKARKYYNSFKKLKIAILGLTFKPNTDDLREAPSILYINILGKQRASLQVYDPVGIGNCRKIFENTHYHIKYCNTIEEALNKADVCFILTEWQDIKNIQPETFIRCMNKPVVLDGRNCFEKNIMQEKNIIYHSIG